MPSPYNPFEKMNPSYPWVWLVRGATGEKLASGDNGAKRVLERLAESFAEGLVPLISMENAADVGAIKDEEGAEARDFGGMGEWGYIVIVIRGQNKGGPVSIEVQQ